jgi:glycosyltransferase involved in cell wall biosynthesis
MITVSAIVACKNEERNIARCIEAILSQRTANLFLEVIVVDNGSKDRTFKILEGYGSSVQILSLPVGTISEVRNYGASNSKGEWLAFIDADVELTPNWSMNLVALLAKLSGGGVELSNVITGSTYLICDDPTWVERVWFEHLESRDKNNSRYINGGNLVIHRGLFEKIGGFSPAYRTGEDEDLCSRAIAEGALVVKERGIAAIHHGYPKNLSQFFGRERWHGLGMVNYIFRPWQSRDLTLSLFFLGISIAACLAVVLGRAPVGGSIGLGILCTIFPVLMLGILRGYSRPIYIIPMAILYYVYGWARVASLIDVAVGSVRRSVSRKR